MEQNVDIRKAAGRTLAIFAFIFVVIIGIFGSLLIARAIPNVFSGMASAITSIFISSPTPPEETPEQPIVTQSISLSLSEGTVSNNQTFTLSWGHTGRVTAGTYTFRYDCVNGVSFSSPTASGAPTPIECGSSFNLAETIGSIALTVKSTVNADAPVTLHIDFIPQGLNQAAVSGAIPLTVKKPVAPATPPVTPGPGTTTTYPTTVVSDPNGHIDLSVRMIGVGMVNRNTGAFYAVSYPSRSSLSDRIAIRFEVKNTGTKTSPAWFFRANLPTAQNDTFNSQAQTALRPGESIIFTLAFDSFVNSNSGVASITVDPSNYIVESNENNNFITQTINTVP